MKYAIGDIHGGSRTFKTLLDRIDLRHSDTLFLLGDYVDRGPDSRGVLDIICLLADAGYDIRAVRGNHDDLLLRAILNDHNLFSRQYRMGWGWHTVKSFGVDDLKDIPGNYINLLESMPYMFIEDDYIFVHAGLDMQTVDPLRDTDPLYMLWDTSRLVDRRKVGGRKLVTGHVIDYLDDIRVSVHTGNIRLDNGAFTNQQPEMGNLVALNLDTREFTIQPWYDGEAVY